MNWPVAFFLSTVVFSFASCVAVVDGSKSLAPSCEEMEIILQHADSNTTVNFKGRPASVYGWSNHRCPKVEELLLELNKSLPDYSVKSLEE